MAAQLQKSSAAATSVQIPSWPSIMPSPADCGKENRRFASAIPILQRFDNLDELASRFEKRLSCRKSADFAPADGIFVNANVRVIHQRPVIERELLFGQNIAPGNDDAAVTQQVRREGMVDEGIRFLFIAMRVV